MTQRQTLRQYQLDALDGIRGSFRNGNRRVLLILPTGGGKTTVAAEIIHLSVSQGRGVMFVAHRKELIDQASTRLDQFGVDHGVIMSTHPRWKPWLPVQVASVQTLAARKDRVDIMVPDLVIIDEAHRAQAKSYLDLLERYPNAFTLGLTATPWRTDGRGLADLFQDSVLAATPAELTEMGFLVPCTGFTFGRPDLAEVEVKRGDYVTDQIAAVMNKRQLNGELVDRWIERAKGERTVVFAVNVEHSKAIIGEFIAAGVPAEHLDGTTPTAEREGILARLKSGETLVVSNVGVLTEGWDEPSVSCVILARPTKSLSLALQMIGRGRRPFPGKSVCKLHDHAGILLDHGLPDEDRDWSLSATVKRRRKSDDSGPSVRLCPECLCAMPSVVRTCPSCQFEFPAPEQSQIETVKGGLIDFEELAELRKGATSSDKAAEYKRLLGVAERKGYAKGWAAHQYRATYGVWPRFPEGLLDSVEPAKRPPVPLEILRKIKQTQEVAA